MKPRILGLLWPFLLAFLFAILVRATPGVTARQYTVFDYQCPDSCLCAPDIQDRDMLVIGCNWPYVQPEMFAKFTRNLTKSLTIHCVGGGKDRLRNSMGSSTFRGFSELRELKISNCSLDALPADTFIGLDKLHTLSISGFGAPAIDDKLFQAVPQIERLWMTRSELKRLPNSVMCPLKGLQILTLSNNHLSDIRLGLDGDDCRLEHLVLLDVSGNRIRHVAAGDLKPYSNIRRLSAGSNQIDDLDMDIFQSTPLIQYLDLESNLLKSLPALPDSLLHLNVADNRLEALPATVANLENLVSLNASRNEIDVTSPFSLYSSQLDSLDLSRNRFKSIPSKLFPRSIEVLKKLWMAGNRIEELENGMFANFSSLQTLDLSDNLLESLPSSTFDGLLELNELRLSNNSIYHVDVEAFRPLGRQLRHLDMSANQLAELPIAIGRLARANTLDFSRNLISKAYKFNLNKITHLSRLDLSDNRLELVESYVFADCPHLTELNLRNNKVRELSGDAFQKCPQLRTLDLSQNELETLDGALRDIRTLRHLNLTHNKLPMLNWAELPGDLISLGAAHNRIALLGAAGRSRLRRLELHHNQLTSLFVEQLPDALEHLNISYNKLRQIEDGAFVPLKQLKSVDARHNQLEVLGAQSFAPTSSVVKLFLSSNPLNCSCQTEWLRNATSLNAAPVQLADHSLVTCRSTIRQSSVSQPLPLPDTNADDFVCEYREEMCEPNCVCCQYTSCDCKSRCPKGCRCFHDGQFKLNVVQCEADVLTETSEPFSVRLLPMHATHIRLRNINLPLLKQHDFSAKNRLVELEINGTGLVEVEPKALNKLEALKTLSIVNNQLQQLNGTEFVLTQHVRQLRLSNNRLSQLEVGPLIEMFPQLKELYLDGNAFVDLPAVLDEWSREGQLEKVHLGMNPFRCDCQTQTDRYRAQQWIKENAQVVVDLKQVLCVENVTRALKTNDTAVFSDQSPNEGADLFVMPMVEFLKLANRTFCTRREMGLFSSDPVWNNLLIIILCLFMALLLVVAVWTGISVVRRSRHTLKNPRYRKATNSSSFLNGVHSMSQGSSPQPLIHYDIFMSYSQADADDVRQNLCMPLHSQYSLEMLHRGDIVADQANDYTNNSLQCVSDELIHKMSSCRTLLWYLTQNFIRREWTSVAVKTAHKCFVQDRQRLVIVLLGHDVDTDELDSELGQMLRRNIRIINMNNNPLWWTLLASHLPRPNQSGDGTFGVDDMADNQSETTQIYSDLYGNTITNDRPIVPSGVV